MHSLFIIFPGFILSLSLFHFSITLHRFQTTFDSLTPSVIQLYITSEIQDSSLQFWLDPFKVAQGIENYFERQLFDEQTSYTLQFQFFKPDQITFCDIQCHGVLTTLHLHFQFQTISFSRHYQLVTQ